MVKTFYFIMRWALVMLLMATSSAWAALNVDSVTVDGSSSVNVAAGASVNVSVNVTTSGWSPRWRSTSLTVDGVTTCVDHANRNSAGSYSEALSVTAPSTAGSYALTVIASSDNDCGSTTSAYTLSNAIVVIAPRVSSIVRANHNPTIANNEVSWTITFNTPVTGVDASVFSLVQTGGATGASIESVTGSGSTWTVSANTGTGSTGTLGLNLLDNDSITSVALSLPLGGSGAGNGNFTGEIYSLTSPAPVLQKTASASSALLNDVVTFTITATNPYNLIMSGVAVSDVLPAGMSYSAHVATIGTVTVSGQTISWVIPAIPANGSAQLTLAVALTASGPLTNTVTSSGAAPASDSILVLSSAVTHFRMDSPAGSWIGASGEVIDSGSTGLHGTRLMTGTSTTTNEVAPVAKIAAQYSSVVGGFCNAASFDGNAVVRVTDSPLFDYTTKLSASAWIYPTATPSEYYSILSNDVNYEFHLSSNRNLYWWWNSSTLTSAKQIPLNQWTHVAITFSSAAGAGRQRIYINGVLDTNTNSWTGTLAPNVCPFYIGGDISTGAACSLMPARNFRGMVDEVKLYNYELSAAEVQADMTLGRSCSGSFDHIQIEHDGVASICSPETVTVKACLDPSCSALYAGNVTVRLSPTGWVGGDTFSFSGGITSRRLSNSTAGNVTLGTVSASPAPVKAVRCLNGASETCVMNFASASCAFDAAEVTGSPQSRLYTKLAGEAFNLDLLALGPSSTINTGYAGTVSVDLVDASSSACPTGTGLTATTDVTYDAGNAGRKTVSFAYPNAARNVKVRAKVGNGTPACSADNFAIRPQSFVVTSPDMTSTGLTSPPKATAGTAFSLVAASGVASGYDGTPILNAAKVNDHNGATIAPGTLSGSFGAGTGASATGSGFKYLDVGTIRLMADAVVDSGFSSVDQTTDCVANSTSNTPSGGKYGCNIGNVPSSSIGRWYPNHYSFAGVLTPGCAAGTFTYMNQDALGVAVTLKAHATSGAVASASDPVVSRYTTGYPNLASVTLTGDNAGSAVAVTRLASPTFPTMPNTDLWSSGEWSINETYALSKLAAIDGPFDGFKLVASLVDPDGASLIGANTDKETNTTRVRYGRARLSNAYGSEILDLPVPFRTEYWNGLGWVLNTADSCTGDTALGADNAVSLSLASSPASLTCIMDNGNPGLSGAGCATAAAAAKRYREGATPALTPAFAGDFSLWLSAPGAGKPGNTTVTAAVPAWLGAVAPARIRFGVYKSPLIYRHESF